MTRTRLSFSPGKGAFRSRRPARAGLVQERRDGGGQRGQAGQTSELAAIEFQVMALLLGWGPRTAAGYSI